MEVKKNEKIHLLKLVWSFTMTEFLKLCLIPNRYKTISEAAVLITFLLIILNCISNSCAQELEDVVVLSKEIL